MIDTQIHTVKKEEKQTSIKQLKQTATLLHPPTHPPTQPKFLSPFLFFLSFLHPIFLSSFHFFCSFFFPFFFCLPSFLPFSVFLPSFLPYFFLFFFCFHFSLLHWLYEQAALNQREMSTSQWPNQVFFAVVMIFFFFFFFFFGCSLPHVELAPCVILR